jgi:hypothetical protein
MSRPGAYRTVAGASLAELIVYMFLAILVLLMVVNLFIHGRQIYQGTETSYVLSDDTINAVDRLQRDLRQTALHTIVVEQTGASMISAMDDEGDFIISPYGVPQWSRFVHYTVQPGEKGIGALTRWEETWDDIHHNIPLIPTNPAFPISSQRAHVLSQNVLQSGYQISKDSSGEPLLEEAIGADGGFQVRFVRAEDDGLESFSTTNPSAGSEDDQTVDGESWASGNTPLVQVDLTLVELSRETGALSSTTFDFRVTPRH